MNPSTLNTEKDVESIPKLLLEVHIQFLSQALYEALFLGALQL